MFAKIDSERETAGDHCASYVVVDAGKMLRIVLDATEKLQDNVQELVAEAGLPVFIPLRRLPKLCFN